MYTRVWVPELNAYKIIGELTGEEALELSKTIPEGSTQWGWNAGTGTFAYGDTTNSRIDLYQTPPPEVAHTLRDMPEISLDIATGQLSATGTPSKESAPFTPSAPASSNGLPMAAGLGIMAMLMLFVFAAGRK
jgi:hypothetical protein